MKQFLARTAYNRDFGTGDDEIPSNTDSRWPLTATQEEFLGWAQAGTLVPGRWYWITDATPKRPLWCYAETASTWKVISPADVLITDVNMDGFAMRVADSSGNVIGTLGDLADNGGRLTALVGSSKLNPENLNDLDRNVAVAGQRVTLTGPQIELYLPGAKVGSTLAVSAVDGDFATIVAVDPVPPAYSVSASSTADVPVVADGATWVPTVTGGAPDFPTTQEFPIGAITLFSLHIANSGQSGGSVDIGFQIEDAAVPGVWSGPAAWFTHLAVAGSATLFSRQVLNAIVIPTNSNVRMVARATASATELELGEWDFQERTIGAVDDGKFRTDDRRMDLTSQLKFSYENDAGQDVGVLLLDIQIGSTLTMVQGSTVGQYVVDTVADDVDGVLIDVTVTSAPNTGWSGKYVLSAFITSAAMTVVVQGSVQPSIFTISEAA